MSCLVNCIIYYGMENYEIVSSLNVMFVVKCYK